MQYDINDTPFKYGIIKDYDGLSGKIITIDNIYYFICDDILNNEIIKNDDFVRFNSKCDNSFPQAYFITKNIKEKTK